MDQSDLGVGPVNRWTSLQTARLWLDVPSNGDVDDLHALHADPASWTHFPQGRHRDRATTEALVVRQRERWEQRGLGYWVVREVEGGPVLGLAGCSWREDWPGWNLAFRFATSVQGRGWATEVGRTSLAAAAAVDPEAPVLAYLLEHNHASRRTAERLGLQEVWRGPDAGNDDPVAVRLVHADRPVAVDLLQRVAAR